MNKISEVEKLRNHYTAKTILRQTKGVMTEAQEAFVAEHFNPSIKDQDQDTKMGPTIRKVPDIKFYSGQ